MQESKEIGVHMITKEELDKLYRQKQSSDKEDNSNLSDKEDNSIGSTKKI